MILGTGPVPPAIARRLPEFLARLSPEQLRQLATASEPEAARLLFGAGAEGLAGPEDGGLGWINFVIQAAAAVYSGYQAKQKGERAQVAMRKESNAAIREENARRATILKLRKERDALAPPAAAANTAPTSVGQNGPIIFGGVAILAGFVYYLIRRNR